MTGDARNNNQRVTNALLQRDLDDISKKLDCLPEIKGQLNNIDKQLAINVAHCQQNKEDIDDLQRKSNTNDVIVGIGAIVAGIIGSLFGGNH